MEEWKEIRGFENQYEVSTYGRVRSLDRIVETLRGARTYKGRLLKTRLVRKYPGVSLCRQENGKIDRTVHRLVAETFIPNPENLPAVNHIDTNTINNRLENLEWISWSGNNRHPPTFAKMGARNNPNYYCKLNPDLIDEIIDLYSSGLTRHEIAELYNISHVTVWRVLKDKHWVKK